MYNGNLVVPWIMGRNRWVMHLLFWLGWAAVLAVFFFHVVQGQVQDRTEFAIYLALHVRWGVLQYIALHEVREFSYGLSQSLVESRQSDLFKRMLPHLLLNLMPTLHHIVRVNYSRVEEAFDSATELLKFFARLPSGRCIPAADELRQVRELISLKEIALKQDIHIRWELD